ncbi:MAG: hypothetical protein GTN37_00670 [Candidatus Aenigmarchaeota archaeon]|nr:hypothetical protein [Candidatus Aenigmarchaeota archaeon]NIQ18168.1 hypothetical protein [Candidatus Aenigmarchaeota archaeon]NIS72925.1 hypothetical protein [Candidatus Aenigmarchaeota archaeon]
MPRVSLSSKYRVDFSDSPHILPPYIRGRNFSVLREVYDDGTNKVRLKNHPEVVLEGKAKEEALCRFGPGMM